MLKSFFRTAACLLAVSLFVFTTACIEINQVNVEQYRKAAEAYLSKLEEAAPSADTLTIDPDEKVDYLGSDFIIFKAWSMNYQEFFNVFVNMKDNSAMDTYYEAYLWEEADEKVRAFMEEHELPTPSEVTLPHTISSKLSGAKVKSMSELWKVMDGSACVYLTYPDLSQEELMPILKAMLDENLYAKVKGKDSDAAYYVLRDGVFIEEPSGKDGGKMIERYQIKFNEDE